MSGGSIYLPKNVNIDDVSIGPLKSPAGKKGDSGKKNVSQARYASLKLNNDIFSLQIPEMKSPFGLNVWENDNGTKKYSILLSFDGLNERMPLQVFKKLFEDIDNKVLQHALDNSQEWFKKKYNNLEVVKAIFTPSIKPSIDKETGEVTDRWPSKIKIDLEQKDGQFLFECFDKKQNRVNILDHDMKKGSIITIIQCGGIWVVGGKFGIKWKAKQICIKPVKNFKEFAFIDNPEDNLDDDDDDSEDDDEKKDESPKFVDDDDDDDSESDEDDE